MQNPPAEAASSLRISLLYDDDAREWADEAGNVARWRALYDACSWGTTFQTPEFFHTWFRHYGERWRPILVLGFDDHGNLQGLLPLAAASDLVTGVGANQAEYHGLIGSDACPTNFLRHAVDAVLRKFANLDMRLRYLPARMPKDAVASLVQNDRRAIASEEERPLLALDKATINDTLKKKNTRSKINRLKRLGALSIRKMDAVEFAPFLDQVSAMCDFRQGAVNDSCPFLDDARKRPFHLDWIGSMPSEVHVSGMFVGGVLVSILIFALSKRDAHVAITAHSPEYAEHSPGKIHIYEAALMLAHDGFDVVDLTSGGDAWKARFATHFDGVVDLTVYASVGSAGLVRLRRMVAKVARPALATFKHRFPNASGHRAAAVRAEDIFALERGPLPTLRSDPLVRVNSLADLLQFGPSLARKERRAFLSEALARMEAGARCYALCEPQGAIAIGWCTINDGFKLFDFSNASEARARSAYGKIIERMFIDIGAAMPARIALQADDPHLKLAVEALGFQIVRP